MKMHFEPNPTTPPPDPTKAYLPIRGDRGETQWVLVHTDGADGLTDADFDFPHRKAGK